MQNLGYVLSVISNILMWVVVIALIEPKYIIRWKSLQFPPTRRTVLKLLLPIYLSISILSMLAKTEFIKNLVKSDNFNELEKFQLSEEQKMQNKRDRTEKDF